jgi:cell division protein FtsI (penicillin-binding protein 3)
MKKYLNKWVRFRISLIFCFFLIGFGVLFTRAYNLQVMRHDEFIIKAENQRVKSVPLTPKRGFIYDKNGEMLAVSIDVDSVYVNPKEIKNTKAAAKKLSKILKINRRVITRKLKNKKSSFVWLKRKASFDEAEQIKTAAIKGVDTVKESKRYYPNLNLAGHTLGFAGIDSEGLEGLELKYDFFIKGDQEYLYREKDAHGQTVSLKETTAKWGDGCDLYLTIDKSIQYITEVELKKAVIDSGAKSGVAIVQEPSTGKILAMASYPDFNPNIFNKYSASERRNRAITDSFDPGSTFKSFVVAAALEEKAIKKDELFYCENGLYIVDSVRLRDTKKHGWLTPRKIIKYSSNIGSIKIAEKIGFEKLGGYIDKFGFGNKSGIDLHGEAPGLVRNYKKWRRVDFSTIAFGQGFSTTALQTVNAFSALANGGKLMKPYVVESIMTKDKSIVKRFDPEIKRFVVSNETAKKVTSFMTSVVKEGGTGTLAAIDNFTVAGKTGTSQKVDHELKQYSNDKFIGSFIGYAPANDPIVTVGVFIDEPEETPYGGVVAAPVFKRIVSQILNLRGTSPVKRVAENNINRKNNNANKVSGVKFAKRNIQYVKANNEKVVMPDLSGLSVRQILDAFSKTEMDLNIKGSGKVVEQFPMPGEIISKGKEVIIRCASSL